MKISSSSHFYQFQINQKMATEIEQLISEFSAISYQHLWQHVLNLEKRLCALHMSTNRQFPSDDELELSIGISNAQFLKHLRDMSHHHFPDTTQFSKARQNPNDPQSLETIRQAIQKMQNVVHISKTEILFLENLVEAREEQARQKAEIHLEEVKAINELVWNLHSLSNATDFDHAYELFDDGEIQSTKGGDIYGERSYFQTAGPLILAPVFYFPSHRSGFTFAILKYEDCLAIRQRMLKLAV